MNKNKVSTTVKIDRELYNEFKIFGVRHNLTLQDLMDKIIYRYVNEDTFRDTINNFIIPTTTTFVELQPTSSLK